MEVNRRIETQKPIESVLTPEQRKKLREDPPRRYGADVE